MPEAKGDILNVFDNDQVIGKTYIVKPNNKVNVSIITNRAWIPLHNSRDLQSNPDLLPGKWMGEENQKNLKQAVNQMMTNSHPCKEAYDRFHR